MRRLRHLRGLAAGRRRGGCVYIYIYIYIYMYAYIMILIALYPITYTIYHVLYTIR